MSIKSRHYQGIVVGDVHDIKKAIEEGGGTGGVTKKYVDDQDQILADRLTQDEADINTTLVDVYENLPKYVGISASAGSSGTLTEDDWITLNLTQYNFIKYSGWPCYRTYTQSNSLGFTGFGGGSSAPRKYDITVTRTIDPDTQEVTISWEKVETNLQLKLTAGTGISIDSTTNTISASVSHKYLHRISCNWSGISGGGTLVFDIITSSANEYTTSNLIAACPDETFIANGKLVDEYDAPKGFVTSIYQNGNDLHITGLLFNGGAYSEDISSITTMNDNVIQII